MNYKKYVLIIFLLKFSNSVIINSLTIEEILIKLCLLEIYLYGEIIENWNEISTPAYIYKSLNFNKNFLNFHYIRHENLCLTKFSLSTHIGAKNNKINHNVINKFQFDKIICLFLDDN